MKNIILRSTDIVKIKITIIILGLMLVCNASYSQETGIIKGKIIEQATKQPVLGALVQVRDTQLGASTDTAGVFIIRNVPEGNYSIALSCIGYQQKIINDVIVVRNKTYYLETELIENALVLNDAVVTSFRNENNPMTPVSSYAFSREEIFRNPGAQGDIFRAIGILPGVSSSGGQFSAIAVRGQGTRDNVYMVDDMPMFEVSHLEGTYTSFNDPNGGRFSIFAPRVIDNALFQGGGFAAQFGRKSSSFLSLGIKEGNIETPSVSGQFDLLGATFIYDGPSYFNKKTSIFATARYQNFYLATNLVGIAHLGLPAYSDYMIKTTTEINSKNKLSLIAMYNPETFVRDVNHVKLSKKAELTDLAKGYQNKSMYGFNLRTLIGNKSYWKNIMYYRLYSFDFNIGNSFPQVDADGNFISRDSIRHEDDVRHLKNQESELGYRSIFTTHIKLSTLTVGVDVARVDIDFLRDLKHMDTLYTFHTTDFRPDPSQYYLLLPPEYFNSQFKDFTYNASSYLDYSFTLFKCLSLNSGVRYDYTGFTEQHIFSPRISGSFNINQKQNINFATGIFYQDPIHINVADQPMGNKLKNERTLQYILGYKNYFSQDLKFVVESWYKQFNDLAVRPRTGEGYMNNVGTGYAYGADINITKRLSKKYYGQTGYSYMQSKRDNHDGFGEYNFTYSQPHIFSLLASYKPNNKWVFSTKFRYATGRPKDSYIIHPNVFSNPNFIRASMEITGKNTDRLNDFISLDARIDYRVQLKRFSVTSFIDMVNVLNRFNQSSELFQPLSGQTYYDGLALFPSFGLRIEL